MYFIALLLSLSSLLYPARAAVPHPPWRRDRGERGAMKRAALACSFFRSREEKKLAHLAGHVADNRPLLRPCHRLVDIRAFQYPESAHVLFGLGVWPIRHQHLAVALRPQCLGVGGWSNPAGELPHPGGDQLAVHLVDLFHHLFGYGRRVEVVGHVVANQKLWHRFFSLVFVNRSR